MTRQPHLGELSELDTAYQLAAAGISVVPVAADGTKRPALKTWAEYQQIRASAQRLYDWFAGGDVVGIGAVTGAVSGGLEMTEIEGRAAGRLHDLTDLAKNSGLGPLWTKLSLGWLERSPSGGLHWFYRVKWLEGQKPPGNTKLASQPSTDTELSANPRQKLQVIAETRGEGGFVVTAPSTGKVHPTGKPWVRLAGGPNTVPEITPDEREAFHSLFGSLHEPLPDQPQQEELTKQTKAHDNGGIKPGDDYENKIDWCDILIPVGWTFVYASGRTRYWRRPGKTLGISATTGRSEERDRLFAFTSSTEFEQEVPYTKFGAFTILHHQGDHSAAASALRAQGFGEEPHTNVPVHELKPFAPEPSSSRRALETSVTEGNLATVIELADRERKPRPELITRSLDRSDDGNALALIDHYGDRLRYNAERGRWLAWNGSFWEYQPSSGGQARECAKTIARSLPETDNAWKAHKKHSLSANGIANMLRQAETDPAITVRTEQLDAHPWELNTPGGIIDLRRGELIPADPTKLHTRRTAFTPDFDAEPVPWNKFLADTFPDETLAAFMQRLTGYSAVGEVTAHILPFCYGSGGNGKSAFLETVIAVLGDYATTSPSGFLMASNYSQHSTEIARLAGQRLVVCSEVNESDRFDEAKVKQLTGGDRLTARFMRQDDFTFKPAHTLWLAGNFQPAVESGGEGFWRRIRQIPFTQTVPAEQRIEGLVEHLVDRHGPGILAWIVQGAALYATNGLQEPHMVRTATQQYAADVDTVGLFLEDSCIVGSAATYMTVPVATLRNAYEKWCADCGETPLRGRAFTAQLVRHGVEAGRNVASKGTRGARLYGRIGLIDGATMSRHDRDRGGY